jgi:hypothetical protein
MHVNEIKSWKESKTNGMVKNAILGDVYINCQRFVENFMGHWRIYSFSDIFRKKE